jgi:hypothetical protein
MPEINSPTYLASPRLYQDKVLMQAAHVLLALDRRTGERRWSMKADARCPVAEAKGSRNGGSPLVMTIGDTPVVVTGSGGIVRLADGKLFEAGIPSHLGSVGIDDAQDIVYGQGNTDKGSSVWGMALKLDGEKLSVTGRWVHSNSDVASLVFANGRVFNNGFQHTLDTGLPLGASTFKTYGPTSPKTRHILLVTQRHVFGARGESELDPAVKDAKRRINQRGVVEVFTHDGKRVAENVLSVGPWDEAQKARTVEQGFPFSFSYSCGMNIGGDRLYLVSQDYLFCIGAK